MTSPPERVEGTVDPKLLEILVCPRTKGPLEFDATRQELISRSAKLAYRIRDGIRSCCRKRPGRSTKRMRAPAILWLLAILVYLRHDHERRC